LHPIVSISCFLGLVLPLVILFFNKGYRTANLYLACFLFFASLYVLENFIFFYSISLHRIAFATTIHAFFYLIGPFAFFYIRSILRDNSKLSKTDYLHFVLFVISFIGYIPYFFTSWDYKLTIAQNIMSENWDIAPFHLNKIFPHQLDQVLNVLNTYFYSISLWYLIRHYKKPANRSIIHTKQYKLIRNWVLIFATIYSVITINFTIAMSHLWIYDNKSIFLDRANVALLFTAVIYIAMNMAVLFFPHIMYGLPVDIIVRPKGSGTTKIAEPNQPLFTEAILLTQEDSIKNIMRSELQLFTPAYVATIEASLKSCIKQQVFLSIDFKLAQISNELGIPAHHLTYFFNEIMKISFSEWRNDLRINYAKELINQGSANTITLHALSLQCGFASQSTFIRAFKIATGNSPSHYLKSHS